MSDEKGDPFEWDKDWRRRKRYLNPGKHEPGDGFSGIASKTSGTYIDDLTGLLLAVIFIVAFVMLLPLILFALIWDWRDTYETIRNLWEDHVDRKKQRRQQSSGRPW